VAQSLPGQLAQSLDQWYARAQRVAPGRWGIAITDGTGRLLWSINPDEPLVPASTAKIFTTGFARSVVGGQARIATRVTGRGHVDGASGEWSGSWALELNGDPTLERKARSGPMLRDLARQLRASGIRRLSGGLVVRSSTGSIATEIPSAWQDRYLNQLYAPPVGAVTLHENTVSVSLRPGRQVGDAAEVYWTIPAGLQELVRVEARTVPGQRSNLVLESRSDGTWVVGGTIGIGARRAGFSALPVRPDRVLEAAWAAALTRAGITWDRGAAPARPVMTDRPAVLAEVTSAPFDSLASEVNRRSLNVGAELLLRWATGTGEAAARLTEHVRAVVGSQASVQLHDGSGLSPLDRVAPRTQALYLAQMPRRPGAENFPLLLPANGYGTLRRLGRGVLPPGVVRAKTGTLDSVSALAGYLGRRDGVLVISALYNGPRSRTAKAAEWALFRLLGADGIDLATAAASESHLGGDEAKAP
jgi:D-alanyl-D-alanine carboxypeptidase/D-alanyl-D-alanine-endopeptidase (penicillin-binding protein 4)